MTITDGFYTGTAGDMSDILQALHGRDTIESAVAYHRLGWPVAIGHRQRTGSGCTCRGDSELPCVIPGAHPAGDIAEPVDPAGLAAAFAAAPGAGVIVPCPPGCGLSALMPWLWL